MFDSDRHDAYILEAAEGPDGQLPHFGAFSCISTQLTVFDSFSLALELISRLKKRPVRGDADKYSQALSTGRCLQQ